MRTLAILCLASMTTLAFAQTDAHRQYLNDQIAYYNTLIADMKATQAAAANDIHIHGLSTTWPPRPRIAADGTYELFEGKPRWVPLENMPMEIAKAEAQIEILTKKAAAP